MTTTVYFREGVVPLTAGAPDLPLVRFVFDIPLEIERDTGEPISIEDVAEGGQEFARLTSLQTGEIITFSNETRTGESLGMNMLVEKIEHIGDSSRPEQRG